MSSYLILYPIILTYILLSMVLHCISLHVGIAFHIILYIISGHNKLCYVVIMSVLFMSYCNITCYIKLLDIFMSQLAFIGFEGISGVMLRFCKVCQDLRLRILRVRAFFGAQAVLRQSRLQDFWGLGLIRGSGMRGLLQLALPSSSLCCAHSIKQ